MNLVAAVVTAGSPVRRALGVMLSIASMTPVWWVPVQHTLFRALWVIIAFSGMMRTVDLRRGHWTLKNRLVHVTSVVDERRLVRARPSADLVALGQTVLWLIPAWLAYYAMWALAVPVDATGWLVRWSLGLVFVYTLSAGAYRILHFVYRALGFIAPPLHIAPAAARTVQEFWGERWNRTVSLWLGETFFRPLARRRKPLVGAFIAFLASALLHAYVAWVAVGAWMGMWMLVFFLAQAVIIGLERAIRARAWSPWIGHAWTVAWMAGLSPMFTEPMARTLGV